MTRNFLCIELTLNYDLGSDTRVVGTRYPQSIFARHACMTNQAIHDGLVKGVTHVQGASDIGGWQLNGKIILTFEHGGISNTPALPLWTPVGFDRGGFIGFSEFVC